VRIDVDLICKRGQRDRIQRQGKKGGAQHC
jgi:hypothetical protein